ncbi:TPA: hypothetical protein ACXDAZ_002662 [Clostridium botulinum]
MEIKFIYIDEESEIKEIKQLLDKGLIKYLYGRDYGELHFIYLSKNESVIKDTIKTDYNITNFIEGLSIMFESMHMTVKSNWYQEVYMSFDQILNLIEDDLDNYIPDNKQKEIFNADDPSEILTKIINEIGRNQLKMKIEKLLMDVDKTEFV